MIFSKPLNAFQNVLSDSQIYWLNLFESVSFIVILSSANWIATNLLLEGYYSKFWEMFLVIFEIKLGFWIENWNSKTSIGKTLLCRYVVKIVLHTLLLLWCKYCWSIISQPKNINTYQWKYMVQWIKRKKDSKKQL